MGRITAGLRPRVAGLGVTAACALMGLLLPSAPAAAHSLPGIDATFSKLDVVLTGRIRDRCQLSGGGELNFGELSGNKSITANVGLDCNVPFSLGFESAHGGLAHATLPGGQGPFAGTLGYTLTVIVPTLSPKAGSLTGSFTSAQLVSRRTLSSGEAIAAGGGRLEVRTANPSGAGLLAGEYSERLTVTVTPRL
jgi:spore coat protein U-like protein